MGRPQNAPREKLDVSNEFLAQNPADLDSASMERDTQTEFDADPNKADWEIQVLKCPEGGKGRNAHCFSVDAIDVKGTRERVRENYGPGNYIARVYKNGQLKRQIPWSIAAPLKAADAPQPQQHNSGQLDALSRAMDNQTRMMQGIFERLMTERREPQQPAYQPPPQQDPLEMFKTFATLMTGLREFIQPAGAASGIDLVMKGIELAREIGDEGREKGMMEIIGDVLTKTPLLENLAGAAQGAATAAQPGPVLPGQVPKVQRPPQSRIMPNGETAVIPGGNPQPRPQQQQPQTVQPDPSQEIIGMLAHLCTRAQKGSPPGLYADVILDSVDNPLVLQILQSPGAFETMAQIHPPITVYEVWFRKLLALVIDPSAEDDEHDEPVSHVFGPQHPAHATHGHPGWGGGDQDDAEENGGLDQ